MKLTFLGTGTSSGIPVIGCNCGVCLSTNPQDHRLRCAAFLEIQNQNILIDTGPDIRTQIIRHHIQHLDGILITHPHFDHIIGLDELRPFSWYQALDLYADKDSTKDIKRIFSYLFDDTNIQIGGGLAQFNLHLIEPYQEFTVKGVPILPLLVMHGKLPITGYKIKNLAYLTDVKTLPQETLSAVKNIDTLVINCLRIRSHSTHLNLEEVISLVQQIKPRRAYLIHMTHDLFQHEWEDLLPSHIHAAYDGLELDIPE